MAGQDEHTRDGGSGAVRPGALSALLQEIAAVPASAGEHWDAGLRPGAVIGRFELIRELGRGGFGVVWEARDRELGRRVAFKAVRAETRHDLREERLLREAEAAARLSHPNIVTLYDVGRGEHGPYLVLELLEGRTLADRLSQGALPVRDALRTGVEIARGVAHAHAQGVVHRDLKPANVFVCEDGRVKVLDFGLAHAFGRRLAGGGTSGYMAPEQAEGAPEDERTDVFAIGVMLFQMLAGKLPFPDEKALRSSGKAPVLEVPGAPALGELVGRTLAKEPVKRPRDGGELLEALSSLEREAEGAPPAGFPVVRTRNWPRLRLAALVATGLAVGAAVAAVSLREVGSVAPAASIAVLPFADMSPGKDQEYFADGVAEEILNALTHVRGLRVVGRTSSFSFKGKKDDLRSIGRKLGAATVLEGSVRSDAGRVRVTAQLVKAADGYEIWSESYDREVTGVFAVQDEIARTVVGKVAPVLAGKPGNAPAAAPATSPAAYTQYLIGRQFLGSYNAKSHRRAAEAFERALAIDDLYAPAWAGLARALHEYAYLADEADQPSLLDRARAAAEKAVALDPGLSAGYVERASLRQAAWDWEGARGDAEHALAIDPGSADGHLRYATILKTSAGDRAGVFDHLRKAADLDPLASLNWSLLGHAHLERNEFGQARRALRRALEIDPEGENGIWLSAKVEYFEGHLEEARNGWNRSANESSHVFGRAVVEHALGHAAASREALAEMIRRFGSRYPTWVAEILAERGEADPAFEWLERALARRNAELRTLKTNPWFRPLHADPRWNSLLRKMNLPVD